MTELKKSLDGQILLLTKSEKAYIILTLASKLFENNEKTFNIIENLIDITPVETNKLFACLKVIEVSGRNENEMINYLFSKILDSYN